MTDDTAPIQLPRSQTRYWLIGLLIPFSIGVFATCQIYGFGRPIPGFYFMAVMMVVLTLVTIAGLWLRKLGALWLALVVLSFAATLDLCLWSVNFRHDWIALSVGVLGAIAILAFRFGPPLGKTVSIHQRMLFACVTLFAGWVAYWGLFRPADVSRALPFAVAPLHARFLGSMYLSGAVLMLLAMLARQWQEIRVVTLMLSIWTGMLGIVSLFHLEAFPWSRGQTSFWFFAYICFPLAALWVVWCQRHDNEHPEGPDLSLALRLYLYLQGLAALTLSIALLIAPQFMTTVWPWKIPLLVAHVYGAPFLSFGIGSLYAARQQSWSEARIVIFGTLVFAVGVLIASRIHIGLFNLHSTSARIWFGGFGIVSLALLLFAGVPALHNQAAAE